MKSLLLVDDETVFAHAQARTLQEYRFHVEVAETATTAHELIRRNHYDLILVDLKLNSEIGTGFIRELRAARIRTKIVVWTVMEGELYESAALDAGADDFILKKTPISLVLSRLYAHLRRNEWDLGHSGTKVQRIEVGTFQLDPESHVLSANDTPIQLTRKQTKILQVLAANPARTVPTQELLDKVWGADIRKSPSVLDGALSRLRAKLREHDVDDLIQNVKGRGFKLIASRAVQQS